MSKAMYWDYQAAARVNYAEGRYVASWLNLLEGEEAKDEQHNRWNQRKESTSRQKEIQRLWQQRGLLERTNANLRSCYDIARTIPNGEAEAVKLEAAGKIVRAMIGLNMDAIATVKERIPA